MENTNKNFYAIPTGIWFLKIGISLAFRLSLTYGAPLISKFYLQEKSLMGLVSDHQIFHQTSSICCISSIVERFIRNSGML